MSKSEIKLLNITKKIKNKIILNNISFDFIKGDVIGFVGNNGSGKTTTIKTIFNEITFNSGNVLFNNEKINYEAFKDIVFFPDLSNVPLNLTVNDYITYNCLAIGLNIKDFKYKINEVLEMFELKKYENTKIKHLSSGLKKLALMSFVLVREPKFIFLDEPTANLDMKTKAFFLDIFEFLIKKGCSIFITTHMLEELQQIINKLIIIDNGNILYNEPFDKNTQNIKSIYNNLLKDEKKEISLSFFKGEQINA